MKLIKWGTALILAIAITIPATVLADEVKKVEDFTERTYGFEEINEELIASRHYSNMIQD